MTVWTVVTRRNRRGQFQKTGFEGTWQEASDYARSLDFAEVGEEVYLQSIEDTQVLTESGRYVQIAPTAAEKAAAKVERERLDAVATNILASWLAEGDARTLFNDARAFAGVETTDKAVAALALAKAGWDRAALSRRHS